MALPTDADSLWAAWRALSEHGDGSGWSTIEISRKGGVRILAARRLPGNEEALLAGFPSVALPETRTLPSGRGFAVERPDLGRDGHGHSWISLVRHDQGNPELFTLMSLDVLQTLHSLPGESESLILRSLLARVGAWQDFMERDREYVLGRDAEIGLLGELLVLRDLLLMGMPAASAVDAWKGPLNGLQDFVLGTGAIEVKSTVATVGFEATIHSLEQLDESLTAPLFLSCVRLPLAENGFTLPEFIGRLQELLADEKFALCMLGSRLLHAGYLPSMSAHYIRRFREGEIRFIEVSDDFPRLTRRNVPQLIQRARYEVNIDGFRDPGVTLENALSRLGATR